MRYLYENNPSTIVLKDAFRLHIRMTLRRFAFGVKKKIGRLLPRDSRSVILGIVAYGCP